MIIYINLFNHKTSVTQIVPITWIALANHLWIGYLYTLSAQKSSWRERHSHTMILIGGYNRRLLRVHAFTIPLQYAIVCIPQQET